MEQVINGLALAGIYLLVALGITLIFGITRIVFFAQGELVALGAFLSLALVQVGLPVIWAICLSAVAVGLAAEVLDLTILRPTLARPLNGFIISLGLIVALEAAYAMTWTSDFYSIPPILSGVWQFGGVVVSKERGVLVVATAAATGALLLFLGRTHYGRGMRALAEDRVGARVLGVRVGLMISVVFVVGSALAGLAGGLIGTIFPFTSSVGATFLLTGFAVAIVGGLGNVRGAIVAALLLAMAQTLGGAYISLSWSYAILLIAMVVIILLKPNGLFASRDSAGVDPLGGSHLVAAAAPATINLPGLIGRVIAVAPRLAVGTMVAAGVVAPFLLPSNRSIALATAALVNGVAVYSLWFGFRFAGIFSIAQAAFTGVGAYVTAILATHLGWPFWPEVIFATLGGALVALAFGVISLRTTGSYFVIILFALSELQVVVIQNWTSLTGGSTGIVLASPPDPLFGLVDFSQPQNLYYAALVLLVGTITFYWWLSRSRFGKRLVSLRDNEVLARSLGLNTFRYKLATLVICGATAGLGGVLYAYTVVGIEPTYFNSNSSIQLVLMMIMGGSATLLGPLFGTLVATFLPEFLQLGPYQAQLVYGLLLIGIIILLPNGIVGTLRRGFARAAVAYGGSRSVHVPLRRYGATSVEDESRTVVVGPKSKS